MSPGAATAGVVAVGSADAGIETRGLTVRYAGSDAPALADVDLTIAPGERVGLVGPSGSGKSTLTLALGGLLPASARTSGSLSVFGTDPLTAPSDALRRLRSERIGWVFQNPHAALNPVRRVRDHFDESFALHTPEGSPRRPAPDRRAASARLLVECGLDEPDRILDALPHQLSGGMAQRVAIALARVGDPELLVADEPTSALDTVTQRGILELLRRLADERGHTLLFVSHDLAVVLELCDRVVLIEAGRVLADGPAAAIRTDSPVPAVARLTRAAARFALAVPPPSDPPPPTEAP